ncbi:MAG TPA: hypothetical protein VGG74_34515 [Kofleriaceae bacterium]|jgi:hypothetical protein
MRLLSIVAILAACGGSTSNNGGGSGSIDAPATGSSSMADAAGSGDATCGCHGQADCAVWSNVYVSWYGFNDNSCTSENQHGCNDIAYPAPQATSGQYGTPYPLAANITHAQATEGSGTYDDPITAAASADSDPQDPTTQNPRHLFASAGGVTLTPGMKIYNPEVQKYFIFEDSCIECGDEYACIVSPEDTDDGTVPAGCTPGTNLHIDFWMGPSFSTDSNDLDDCEDNSTIGSDWYGGGGDVIVNPPSDLPVVTGPLYTGSGAHGGCWTQTQRTAASCP